MMEYPELDVAVLCSLIELEFFIKGSLKGILNRILVICLDSKDVNISWYTGTMKPDRSIFLTFDSTHKTNAKCYNRLVLSQEVIDSPFTIINSPWYPGEDIHYLCMNLDKVWKSVTLKDSGENYKNVTYSKLISSLESTLSNMGIDIYKDRPDNRYFSEHESVYYNNRILHYERAVRPTVDVSGGTGGWIIYDSVEDLSIVNGRIVSRGGNQNGLRYDDSDVKSQEMRTYLLKKLLSELDDW